MALLGNAAAATKRNQDGSYSFCNNRSVRGQSGAALYWPHNVIRNVMLSRLQSHGCFSQKVEGD